MPEELEVHVNILCRSCLQPLGPDPKVNCIGEEVTTPGGLVLFYVYHRKCAPKELIWAEMRAMWRVN